MITRRCTQRQFLMRPDPETNNAFIYCLAEAASRFEIDVLFTIANTNHHHTGIYDRHGNYPAFLERFHRLFAKAQNSLRGRAENFWSSEQTSVVRLEDSNAVIDKMTYALTNPVKDHLVESAEEWPGVNAFGAIVHGHELNALRPRHFFREEGVMPAAVTLTFSRPQAFEGLSEAEFRALIRDSVHRAEEAAALDRKMRGVRVLGRRGVLAQDWRGHPVSHEQRGELKPTVATRNKWRRFEALQQNKNFCEGHAAARRLHFSGHRDVIFPVGTYRFRHLTEAASAPSPSVVGPEASPPPG
jgi:putative transposase